MTRVAPGYRLVAGLGLVFSPLVFSPLTAGAQRPVISSCTATPSTVAPGGTATIHVQATSPAGLPLEYTFTTPAGTVQGNGDSATFTAASTATGTVPVLCEARSGQSWVRGRAYIKVIGTATAGAGASKPAPAKPESAVPTTAAKVVQPAASKPAPVQSTPSKPAVAPAQTRSTPPPAVPTPAPAPTHVAPQPTLSQTTPQQASPTPQPAVPAPSQTAPVVSTPAPVQTSVATAPPAADSAAATEWVTQSQDGLIEYAVPQKMIVGRTAPVTVKIHGYSVATGAMRSGSLTAQYLKVLLMAEDPHGLKIVSQGNADVQYVPRNKTTTWVWNVTPMAAANQKLQVRVFEEYKTDAEQDVDGQSYTVKVTKPSWLMLAKEAYFGDQDAWWKYWLPTGAVCFVLLWLLVRFISPRERMPTGTSRNFEASDWL